MITESSRIVSDKTAPRGIKRLYYKIMNRV